MQAEPISVYLQTELQFFRLDEGRFGETFIRTLFFRLNQPGGHPYKNLDLQETPPTLSTTRMGDEGRSSSRCRINPTQITIEHTNGMADIDDHKEAVKTVLRVAMETETEHKRPFPPILGQKTRVQCIAKPQSDASPLIMLAGHASNVLGAITPFKRPPAHFGVKFQFAPHEKKDGDEWSESQEDQLILRFETWTKDPAYIWMDAQSSRLLSPPDDGDDQSEAIVSNIQSVYDFLLDNGIEFLDQFDYEDEDENNDDPEIEEPPAQ